MAFVANGGDVKIVAGLRGERELTDPLPNNWNSEE